VSVQICAVDKPDGALMASPTLHAGVTPLLTTRLPTLPEHIPYGHRGRDSAQNSGYEADADLRQLHSRDKLPHTTAHLQKVVVVFVGGGRARLALKFSRPPRLFVSYTRANTPSQAPQNQLEVQVEEPRTQQVASSNT
jgi:hypothetical protein